MPLIWSLFSLVVHVLSGWETSVFFIAVSFLCSTSAGANLHTRAKLLTFLCLSILLPLSIRGLRLQEVTLSRRKMSISAFAASSITQNLPAAPNQESVNPASCHHKRKVCKGQPGRAFSLTMKEQIAGFFWGGTTNNKTSSEVGLPAERKALPSCPRSA